MRHTFGNAFWGGALLATNAAFALSITSLGTVTSGALLVATTNFCVTAIGLTSQALFLDQTMLLERKQLTASDATWERHLGAFFYRAFRRSIVTLPTSLVVASIILFLLNDPPLLAFFFIPYHLTHTASACYNMALLNYSTSRIFQISIVVTLLKAAVCLLFLVWGASYPIAFLVGMTVQSVAHYVLYARILFPLPRFADVAGFRFDVIDLRRLVITNREVILSLGEQTALRILNPSTFAIYGVALPIISLFRQVALQFQDPVRATISVKHQPLWKTLLSVRASFAAAAFLNILGALLLGISKAVNLPYLGVLLERMPQWCIAFLPIYGLGFFLFLLVAIYYGFSRIATWPLISVVGIFSVLCLIADLTVQLTLPVVIICAFLASVSVFLLGLLNDHRQST